MKRAGGRSRLAQAASTVRPQGSKGKTPAAAEVQSASLNAGGGGGIGPAAGTGAVGSVVAIVFAFVSEGRAASKQAASAAAAVADAVVMMVVAWSPVLKHLSLSRSILLAPFSFADVVVAVVVVVVIVVAIGATAAAPPPLTAVMAVTRASAIKLKPQGEKPSTEACRKTLPVVQLT